MVIIDCNNKCSCVKKLFPNIDNPKDCCCEILFQLVNGTEIFCTPDGRVQQSAYFDIQADSEEEKAQKLKCLRKEYGEENLTVFENIPGKHPIIEWRITHEMQMKLAACVEKLKNKSEQVMEIFEPLLNGCCVNPDPSEFIDLVWNIFIIYRLKLSKDWAEKGNIFIMYRLKLSKDWVEAEDINDAAVGLTIQYTDLINNEDGLEVLQNIANELIEKEKAF